MRDLCYTSEITGVRFGSRDGATILRQSLTRKIRKSCYEVGDIKDSLCLNSLPHLSVKQAALRAEVRRASPKTRAGLAASYVAKGRKEK